MAGIIKRLDKVMKSIESFYQAVGRSLMAPFKRMKKAHDERYSESRGYYLDERGEIKKVQNYYLNQVKSETESGFLKAISYILTIGFLIYFTMFGSKHLEVLFSPHPEIRMEIARDLLIFIVAIALFFLPLFLAKAYLRFRK